MHRFALPFGLGVAIALALAACSQPGATQLIVVVDTDYAIPSELDEIRIDVVGPDGLHHAESEPMVAESDLPYALSVVPRGSALGPVRIEATGWHAGTQIVSRTARVTLVAQQSLMVRLDLLHVCDASRTTCTVTDQTCGDDGRCGSIDVSGVPWTGLPGRLRDAGVGPSDGGAGDTGPGDAGTDAAVDASLPDANLPDAAGAIDAGTDAATAMDAASVDGGSDAGSDAGHDAGSDAGRDAGPDATADAARDAFDCRVSGCNDGNPCTDDVCTMMGTCTHSNNTASCGATTCGAYGTCTNTAMVCSTTGTQSRTCTDHVCAAGVCTSPTRLESAACTRTPSGTTCMTTSCGAWSTCNYLGNCMPTTMQTRSCTDYTCNGSGGCIASMPRTESQPCPQAPAGTNCARVTWCGTYACSAAGACLATGGQCTSPTPYCCSDGTCVANSGQCFL